MEQDHESRIRALEWIITHPSAVEVTLRDHLEGKIDDKTQAIREYFGVQFDLLQRAQERADIESKAKFITVNEFRGSLNDYVATLASKESVQLIIDRVSALERSESKAEGKASVSSVYIGYVGVVIGIVLSILSLLK